LSDNDAAWAYISQKTTYTLANDLCEKTAPRDGDNADMTELSIGQGTQTHANNDRCGGKLTRRITSTIRHEFPLLARRLDCLVEFVQC
jgi:hypothetical protein